METNSRKIIKKLKEDGWELVRTKGSHHQFRRGTLGVVTVPHPEKDIHIKTVESIYKIAGWSRQ